MSNNILKIILKWSPIPAIQLKNQIISTFEAPKRSLPLFSSTGVNIISELCNQFFPFFYTLSTYVCNLNNVTSFCLLLHLYLHVIILYVFFYVHLLYMFEVDLHYCIWHLFSLLLRIPLYDCYTTYLNLNTLYTLYQPWSKIKKTEAYLDEVTCPTKVRQKRSIRARLWTQVCLITGPMLFLLHHIASPRSLQSANGSVSRSNNSWILTMTRFFAYILT